MIDDEIAQFVEDHYKAEDAELLLLSTLGTRLTDKRLWPPASDKRTLREIVESIPRIKLVRDENAAAFIAVVLAGDEQRAFEVIGDRHKRSFLRRLPRALLLAFVLEIADGQAMSLRLGSKVTYHVGAAVDEGAIIVDTDLRIPRLEVSDINQMDSGDVAHLEARIMAWCSRHQVDPTSVVWTRTKPAAAHGAVAHARVPQNALERLFAAQNADTAKLLIVPIDIALALSSYALMTKMKRRGIIQPSGPRPMYVIAGLPKSVHKEAIDQLQDRLPHAIVKGIPSPTQDGELYSSLFINALVRSIGEFVIRRRTNGKAQPSPASITLLFVPSSDQEGLLGVFDFAIMSEPLFALSARDEDQKQLRHDLQAVGDALAAAVAASSQVQMSLNEVKRRLAYRSDNEGLLLPPRNFLTQEGDLTAVFRDFRTGVRAWTDRLAEYGPAELTNDDVPARINRRQKRHPFVDSRKMAFFIAHPSAYDGAPREVETEENASEILDSLRALYRFGGALSPGIHHDAQRSDGASLGGATFHCCRKGPIRSNSGYANIYPSDFVRVAHHEQLE